MYKRTYLILFFGLISIACGGYFIYERISSTTTLDQVRVGVIYPKRIKSEAKPYIQFEQYFEKNRKKIHDEFLEEEKKLRDQFEAFKKIKKSKQSDSQKKTLQEKARDLENQLIARKDEFLQNAQKITHTLQEKLNLSIKKIAAKRKINLVLNVEADEKILVLYSDASLDITESVIQELNTLKVSMN
jgi:Skp family chaperone for outer membrane proteins